MKPLFAIVTFHLKDGREIVDENMALKMINEKEISLISDKRMPQKMDDIDFTTISMLYGNSSRLLFSVNAKQIEYNPTTRKVCYTFNAPTTKKVKIGCREMSITCPAYDKIRSMLKPRTGRMSSIEEVVLFDD